MARETSATQGRKLYRYGCTDGLPGDDSLRRSAASAKSVDAAWNDVTAIFGFESRRSPDRLLDPPVDDSGAAILDVGPLFKPPTQPRSTPCITASVEKMGAVPKVR